eukprot:m.319278 g.319278  ORF g.319278 m.319278 type:complete len:446 (-) comp27588_c0_seq11:1908-3245(-)
MMWRRWFTHSLSLPLFSYTLPQPPPLCLRIHLQDFPYCHGPIDRKEAELRLRSYDQLQAYLLRTKDATGKEFVYSYLTFNKAVNHAKILIKGRTFTIDGRVYEGGPSGVDLFDVVAQCAKLHDEAGLAQGSGVARPRTSTAAALGRSGPASAKKASKAAVADVPVVKSGHLCKRALGRSLFGRATWKERWFVLTAAELSYFSKPIKGTRKGKLATSGILGVESSADKGGNPFVFCILFKVFTLTVQAKSQQDREDWMRTLRDLIGESQAKVATLPKRSKDSRLTEKLKPGTSAATAAAGSAPSSKSKSMIPDHLKAAWYFPEFSRVHCDKVMARAAPGDYIARNSSQGNKIVMVVKDEFFKNRFDSSSLSSFASSSPALFRRVLTNQCSHTMNLPLAVRVLGPCTHRTPTILQVLPSDTTAQRPTRGHARASRDDVAGGCSRHEG